MILNAENIEPFPSFLYRSKHKKIWLGTLTPNDHAQGHLLWNAGRTVSEYLEENRKTLVEGKTILELGAGAGLPSLVCALNGGSMVVSTDYPDPDLVDNLKHNIQNCKLLTGNQAIFAEVMCSQNSHFLDTYNCIGLHLGSACRQVTCTLAKQSSEPRFRYTHSSRSAIQPFGAPKACPDYTAHIEAFNRLLCSCLLYSIPTMASPERSFILRKGRGRWLVGGGDIRKGHGQSFV